MSKKAHKQALDLTEEGASLNSNDKARPKGTKATLRPLSTGRGPVPIATPVDRVQLAPVVQPLALVPYSTQKQPLFMQEEQPMPVATKVQPAKVTYKMPPPKRSILIGVLVILSILALALMVVGDWVLPNIFSLVNGQGVVYIGLNLLDAFLQQSSITINNIIEIALVLSFVLHILLFISLLAALSRGASVVIKILAFIITVLQLGAAFFCYNQSIAYPGLYVSAGFAFVIMLISFIAKRD